MPFLDLEEALEELGAMRVDFTQPIDPERAGLGKLRESFILRRYSTRVVRDRKETRRAFESTETRREYKRRWHQEHRKAPTGIRRGPKATFEGDFSMKVTTFLRELRKHGLVGSVKLKCFGRDFVEGEGIEQLVEPEKEHHEAARLDLMVQMFVAKGWGPKRIAKLFDVPVAVVVNGLRSRNYFVP